MVTIPTRSTSKILRNGLKNATYLLPKDKQRKLLLPNYAKEYMQIVSSPYTFNYKNHGNEYNSLRQLRTSFLTVKRPDGLNFYSNA